MTRDGNPIRVQCSLAVPFTLPEVSQPGPGALVDSVVLQLEAAPLHNFMPVDLAALQEETTAWLAAKGLRRIAAAGADPEHTLHLKLEIQTVQAQGGTYICNVMERCSLLSDLNLTGNEPGKPPRIYFLRRIVGQKGETGFTDCLRRTLQATLQDLVLQPVPPMSKQDLERLRAALPRPEAVRQDKSAPTDFDFSQIKIRKQPPAPPYPTAAKSQHIQGLVIVEIIIDTAGNPIRAEAREGPGELLATAISYALQWEFEPARLNGIPQWARFKLIMPFRLR
jgi:TonB family protein